MAGIRWGSSEEARISRGKMEDSCDDGFNDPEEKLAKIAVTAHESSDSSKHKTI